MRRLLILPLLFVLAGCQFTLPGGGQQGDLAAAADNPITGGSIAVQSLDDPTPAPQAAPATTGPQAAPAMAGPQTTPAAQVALADTPPDAAPADPLQAEPAASAVVKSASQLACEKRKGIWSSTGGGTAAFCQTPTRDGGKQCRASTDCAGYCLAKSGTCAPVTPMMGCHDILNEDGRMLTQCIN